MISSVFLQIVHVGVGMVQSYMYNKRGRVYTCPFLSLSSVTWEGKESINRMLAMEGG